MAYVTANGVPVVTADLRLPRSGAWHADLVLDGAQLDAFEAGTRVTISAAASALTFKGTVRRAGSTRGTLFVKVVGGAAGLGTMVPAKSYRNVNLAVPLRELLAVGGETLSDFTGAALLATQLNFWSRIQQTVGEAATSMVGAAGSGLVWRLLPDGKFWFGEETWPDVGDLDHVLLTDEPTLGRAMISANSPTIYPGQSIAGRHVGYVAHRFEAGALRTQLWFEEG